MNQRPPYGTGSPRQPEVEILPPEAEPTRRDPWRDGRDAGGARRIWIAFGQGGRQRILLARPSPLATLATWLILGGLAVAGLFLVFWALVAGLVAAGAIAVAFFLMRLFAGPSSPYRR